MKSQEKLTKGESTPNFSLKGTDGKIHSLHDFKDKNLLVVFMCNHCPYVKTQLSNLNKLAENFSEIKVIGINPNDSNNYSEDSFEKMKELVDQGKINFLYLHDESQEVAKYFGAVCTPDPFLFDKNHKLIFHAKVEDLPEAIEEFLKKGKITKEENPSMGCSIKWK